MKVLVTGAEGQLGYDVVQALKKNNIECKGTNKSDLDITNLKIVSKVLREYMPDVVIHCASYTYVDRAEDESDNCFLVNSVGTKNIAEICKAIDARLVYISTDYVFDGKKEGYYEVNDEPNPVNIYGKSKLLGELHVRSILSKYYIIRISWAFGLNGNNFVKTMLKIGNQKNEISVVDDQIGSPTYTKDLANAIINIIKTEKYNTYHITNEGTCSWADFAEAIFFARNMKVKVHRISSAYYHSKAKRPLNSKLSKDYYYNNGFSKLRNWEDALKDYLLELGEDN